MLALQDSGEEEVLKAVMEGLDSKGNEGEMVTW